MWSRQNLKERAKTRAKANYWRMVLVAILAIFIGGSTGYSFVFEFNENEFTLPSTSYTWNISNIDDIDEAMDSFFSTPFNAAIGLGLGIIIMIIAVTIILIVGAIAIALRVLILNPLEIGCKRFFARNLNEDAQIKEICYSFDYGYNSNIKTMFFRDLYTFLWSLLFVIPGIVKSYEYRMIPYILSENPGMDTNTAFAISKKMMTGNKWNAFVLDLSFIGWHILNSCTFGILGVFYVNPYVQQTNAALFEALKAQTFSENFQA